MQAPYLVFTHYESANGSHEALRLTMRHGSALIALHGGHLLSWLPSGEREVLWMSPCSLPEPAALRGGVPVCWPWFAKQGQSAAALQHGPVRNMRWVVSAVHEASDEAIRLSLVPAVQAQALADRVPLAEGVPLGLSLRMDLHLGVELKQSLHTENHTGAVFALTQALHSYFAVSDAQRVAIEGLQGLRYQDKLRDFAQDVQRDPFVLDQTIGACDRIYMRPTLPNAGSEASASQLSVLKDAAWQRAVEIEVSGSQSVVVWNPGAQAARHMVDVPDEGWTGFFCVEATNAGTDVVHLAPGQGHTLTQTLRVKRI